MTEFFREIEGKNEDKLESQIGVLILDSSLISSCATLGKGSSLPYALVFFSAHWKTSNNHVELFKAYIQEYTKVPIIY